MLVAYFDESGITPGNHTVLTGGAVADSMTWARIESPWRKWLSPGQFCEKGISCFHATDCENGEKEFSSIDRPFRDAMAWKLSDEIGKIKPHCFAAGVVRKDWGHAPVEVKKSLEDNPFYLSVALCIEQISDWSQLEAGGEKVALVFANQRELNGITTEIHSEYFSEGWPGIGAIAFADPRLVIPLQVADFIAYESYKWRKNKAADPSAEPRRLWKNLQQHGVKMTFHEYNENNLPKLNRTSPGALAP